MLDNPPHMTDPINNFVHSNPYHSQCAPVIYVQSPSLIGLVGPTQHVPSLFVVYCQLSLNY